MIFGLFLIIMGVLIAMYPQLLIGMVSGILIMSGVFIFMMALRFRRMQRFSGSNFSNWIFRF